MGEQPVPVDDEVERALASMRTGFLSGSSQIAAGVASLEEHLAQAPADERERVGATVAQIVATQERLIAQIDRLPRRSWDRFKAMVGIVKAQQVALDELGLLLKERVLPKQLQELSAASAASAARKSAPRRPVGGDDPAPRTRDRTGTGLRGLAAMVVAALVLSQAPKLQDLAARLAGMLSPGVESAPADATVAAELPPRPPPSATQSERRVQPPADADRPDAATVQPEGKRDAAPLAVSAPAAPPAKAPNDQFVPVVFTHQDQATVMQALSDLKQQYPNILIGRKGEVQPVDLGKKGIWHRLVFLPAGSRPEATKLCDQLMAGGYDRCWVKNY